MKLIIENKDIDERTGQISMAIKPKKGEQYTILDVLDLLTETLVNEILDNDISKKDFIKITKKYYRNAKISREILKDE